MVLCLATLGSEAAVLAVERRMSLRCSWRIFVQAAEPWASARLSLCAVLNSVAVCRSC